MMMFGEIQYFQRGTIYRIMNRKTGKCLSAPLHEVTSDQYKESFEQLWAVSEIKNDEFEIAQMKTGEVLTWTQGKGEIKLEKGKMKNNQFWTLERAEIVNNRSYFWIRPSRSTTQTLSASALNPAIKISQIDQTLQICLWEFLPCSKSEQVFKGLSVFTSDLSKLVLDVPQFSHKEGTGIVQYRYQGCGNQRWKIEVYQNQSQSRKQYTIQNFGTGLYLTASFSKIGFKATQTIFNCDPDQRWRFFHLKDDRFMIQSASNEHYFLGVQSDKGGSQVTMTHEQEKAKWIIDGYKPPQ